LTLSPDFDSSSEDTIRVKDVYIEQLYTIELTEPLDNVLLHMAQHHLGSALVTKNGRLAGLYTVTDACRQFSEFLRDHFLPVHGNDAA
jgi:CBS domain-containing protein